MINTDQKLLQHEDDYYYCRSSLKGQMFSEYRNCDVYYLFNQSPNGNKLDELKKGFALHLLRIRSDFQKKILIPMYSFAPLHENIEFKEFDDNTIGDRMKSQLETIVGLVNGNKGRERFEDLVRVLKDLQDKGYF